MAITVNERFEGRTSKIGLYLKRDHVRQFVAESSASERSWAVAQASGVPSLGDAHPEDGVALCVDIDVKPNGAPNVWAISCKYTNDLPDDTIDDDDPTSIRTKSSWSFEDISRFVGQDRDENPILNTAGDRYEEPIEVVDSFPTLTITKNRGSFNASTAFSYNNSVNSDTYRGAEPGTLRVRITATEEWTNDAPYWATSYVFRYNPLGWQPKILEAGLYQLNAAGDRIPCTVRGQSASDSEPVEHPVPLDIAGLQIDPTTLTNTPSPVIYTTWNVIPELPYLSLGV